MAVEQTMRCDYCEAVVPPEDRDDASWESIAGMFGGRVTTVLICETCRDLLTVSDLLRFLKKA